jgi:hypothetical protein
MHASEAIPSTFHIARLKIPLFSLEAIPTSLLASVATHIVIWILPVSTNLTSINAIFSHQLLDAE